MIFAKSHLKKGSLIYTIAAKCYQGVTRAKRKISGKNSNRQVGVTSIFQEEEEMGMCSLNPVPNLDLAWELFKPTSVLDVGCGTGISMVYFRKKGAEVYGLEGSEMAISMSQVKQYIQQADLHQPQITGRKFDLVWCFEVAEHIHPDYVDALVETLTSNGDTLFLSAAHPGQGGLGHFNEQPPEYWIEKLEARGFSHQPDLTAKFAAIEDMFSENILIFKKSHQD